MELTLSFLCVSSDSPLFRKGIALSHLYSFWNQHLMIWSNDYVTFFSKRWPGVCTKIAHFGALNLFIPCIVMQEASDAHSKTADSDTVCSFAIVYSSLASACLLKFFCSAYTILQALRWSSHFLLFPLLFSAYCFILASLYFVLLSFSISGRNYLSSSLSFLSSFNECPVHAGNQTTNELAEQNALL